MKNAVDGIQGTLLERILDDAPTAAWSERLKYSLTSDTPRVYECCLNGTRLRGETKGLGYAQNCARVPTTELSPSQQIEKRSFGMYAYMLAV